MIKILILLAFNGLLVITTGEENNGPTVDTKFGQVQGNESLSRDGRPFFQFWGIPYAKAARFEPPVNPDPWTQVRDATKPGTVCVQYKPKSSFNSKYEGKVVGKEDCLEVNVFTPKLPAAAKHKILLPVLVVFHGGGFSHGTSIFFGPQYFMDTDTVLVTFNSRLGPLGYLNTGDKQASGNQGLKDQVALLKWIQDNIEGFSGDPKRVTILGTGSGASSVDYHQLSPLSQGLFHAAIKQSGSALSPFAFIRDPVKQAKDLGKSVNCPVDTSENLVNCLKGKSVNDLVSKNTWFVEPSFEDFDVSWGPSIESVKDGQAFLTDNPHKLASEGKFVTKIPVIAGLNSLDGAVPYVIKLLNSTEHLTRLNNEWDTLAPIMLLYKKTATDPIAVSKKIRELYFKDKEIGQETRLGIARLVADRFFFQPSKTMAEYHTRKTDTPVYTYIVTYQGKFSWMKFYGIEKSYGVAHKDELQYQFPIEHFKIPFIDQQYDSNDYEFSKKFVQLWASFVENGKPTKVWGEGKEWKKFDPEERPWRLYKMDLNSTMYETPEVLAKRLEFWNDLYANELKREVETPEKEIF